MSRAQPAMSPRSLRISLQIYSWCKSHGWERTLAEIADGINEPVDVVRRVMQLKGWSDRPRRVSPGMLAGATDARHLRTPNRLSMDQITSIRGLT